MKWWGLVGLVVPLTVDAGTLNERFPFPDAQYTTRVVEVEGTPVEFLKGEGSAGDFHFDFEYLPDPSGGHPLMRALEIMELDTTVFQGVIVQDPTRLPGLLRFDVMEDDPLGRSAAGLWTWDVPWHTVPQLGAGWLIVIGGLWGLAYRLATEH